MNPRRRGLLRAAGALPLLGAVPAPAQPPAQARAIEVMRFSALRAGGTLPGTLKPWAFGDRPRHTRYTLVEDEGSVVLRAQAAASTSGLVRALHVDLRTHSVLAWRWKARNLVMHGDIASKAGDDFALRVYVTFDLDTATLSAGERLALSFARLVYGSDVPAAALCYVWDARAPLGSVVPNAYTDRVRMIVAGSGTRDVGRWAGVERDVRADYLRAFGPPGAGAAGALPAVNGVVVSTDTDNTGESVEAYYGDIEFRAPPA